MAPFILLFAVLSVNGYESPTTSGTYDSIDASDSDTEEDTD